MQLPSFSTLQTDSSLLMLYEFGEDNMRHFSIQILSRISWVLHLLQTLMFSLAHMLTGFTSGDWYGHVKSTILFHYHYLARRFNCQNPSNFHSNIIWCFMESMMPYMSNMAEVEEKQLQQQNSFTVLRIVLCNYPSSYVKLTLTIKSCSSQSSSSI